MIITFCGHSTFTPTPEYEQKLLSLLHELVVDGSTEFFLGEYGAFDAFAYECCKKFKATHPNVKLIFVTPYISPEYQKNYLNHQEMRYDHIIYPPLENVPPKFAISRRNKWMVQKADLVIAYIRHDWAAHIKPISTHGIWAKKYAICNTQSPRFFLPLLTNTLICGNIIYYYMMHHYGGSYYYEAKNTVNARDY